MSVPLLLVLCATSAGFYVGATALMKIAGGTPFLMLLLPVLATLGIAAWVESLALPHNRFGIVGLLILSSEVLITACVAVALGERYSLREILGLTLIVIGLVVVCEADGRPADTPGDVPSGREAIAAAGSSGSPAAAPSRPAPAAAG
jgi:uncharacterized membrane protein